MGMDMTERISKTLDTQNNLNVRTSGYESPHAQKVAVAVELPSEYWALISGLSKDVGKDDEGRHRVLWTIDGIQSLDLPASVRDKTMIFNIDEGYDLALFHTHVELWLDELRLRRAEHENNLRMTSGWRGTAISKIGRRSTVAAAEDLLK
jgi:hypothetical protein